MGIFNRQPRTVVECNQCRQKFDAATQAGLCPHLQLDEFLAQPVAWGITLPTNDEPKRTVKMYFGCERDLEHRPSERHFYDMSVRAAWELFRVQHGLPDDAATRSTIVLECE